MSEATYFNEPLYWVIVILSDIVLSGTLGIMLAFLFASNRLIKHNSINNGKAFTDNSNGKIVSYDHRACKELFGQTPEIYEKRYKENRERLKEENLEYFKKNTL